MVKSVLAGRQNQHAGRVRSPENPACDFNLRDLFKKHVRAFHKPTYDAPGQPRSQSRFVKVGCAAPGGGGSRRIKITELSTKKNPA
jgi:hypothetical protein